MPSPAPASSAACEVVGAASGEEPSLRGRLRGFESGGRGRSPSVIVVGVRSIFVNVLSWLHRHVRNVYAAVTCMRRMKNTRLSAEELTSVLQK